MVVRRGYVIYYITTVHAIHTTPGFVIDSRPYGEAGKILSIFTQDLGLVSAIAQGIRLEKSKLRYYVQNYSFAKYSLVRGKEFWRLTSASDETTASSAASVLIAKIAALLRRLLQGEDPHPELFELVTSCAAFLRSSPGLTEEQGRSLESLVVLRILHTLGYIGNEPAFAAFIDALEINIPILDQVTSIRQTVNRHINTALKESQL